MLLLAFGYPQKNTVVLNLGLAVVIKIDSSLNKLNVCLNVVSNWRLNHWVVFLKHNQRLLSPSIHNNVYHRLILMIATVICYAAWPVSLLMPTCWPVSYDWLLRDTNCSMAAASRANSWSRLCVMSNRHTLSLEVSSCREMFGGKVDHHVDYSSSSNCLIAIA